VSVRVSEGSRYKHGLLSHGSSTRRLVTWHVAASFDRESRHDRSEAATGGQALAESSERSSPRGVNDMRRRGTALDFRCIEFALGCDDDDPPDFESEVSPYITISISWFEGRQ
jgi:hypothetical protein